MNIEFDVYKQKLNECRPALEGLAESLNVEGLRNELERLHAMQEAPGFWDDPEKSQKIVVKTKHAENKIGNNLFATLENDKVILNVSYMASDSKIRIMTIQPLP